MMRYKIQPYRLFREGALAAMLFSVAVTLSGQELNGFVETTFAPKFSRNTLLQQAGNGQYYALGEQRLQLKYEHSSDKGELFFKLDFINDNVTARSFSQLREAYFTTTPFEWMDVKIGRQIQTWGVGDLLFINDLFSKDWISFLTGRQDEYLKAPNDALRFSIYSDKLGLETLDVSIMPYAQHDVNIMSEGRFASENPIYGFFAQAGLAIAQSEERELKPGNAELSLRLKMQNIAGMTPSLYGHFGHWNNPNSMKFNGDQTALIPWYGALNVYGFSLRGMKLGGVLSLEAGLYDSRDDDSGTNPLIENSSQRMLALYERSLAPNWDIGLQYYQERILNYDAIEGNMDRFFGDQSGQTFMDKDGLRDELRHLFTLRLTRKMLNETLIFTWFNYYSPSDQDFYLRPKLAFEYSDQIRFSLTANVFGAYGENADTAHYLQNTIPNYYNTMFGQFRKDSSLNFSARYIF